MSEPFQSAPLTEARGDLRSHRQEVRALRVSIRSPHRSKGRPVAVSITVSPRLVSIRSPHRSKGRRGGLQGGVPEDGVSIRSPHRSKGRRGATDKRSGPCGFQSAPLTEARGDLMRLSCPRSFLRFNPLPSPKQGETSSQSVRELPTAKFQSAPLTEARGDPARAAGN